MAEAFFFGAAANAAGTLMADLVKKTLERHLPCIFCHMRASENVPLLNLEFSKSKDLVASNSFTCAFNEIMNALKNDGVNIIGVYGMGGVGKTTLVTQVGYTAKSLQLVHKVVTVVVSQDHDVGKIQDKMANMLDLKFEKKSKEGKARELWVQLNKEEKLLLILDDIWNEIELKEIGVPLNCKIILTTRHRQVCDYMKSQVTVSVDVLDQDEAWTLFRKTSGLDVVHASPDVIDVAKEVAKECGGLPIAIFTLAKALRSKDLNGWELAHGKLKRSRLMDIENVPKEAQKNAYLCLEMSYNHLESETTKMCFLICALFPEDYLIDVEDLVRCASGLGLYQNAGSIQEVRSEVFEAINNLKGSCLLLEDDRKRYIKVHQVLRDVALWIAFKEDNGLVTKFESDNNGSSNQKLEILLDDNYDNKTQIDQCFEGMRELKVLSLKSASEANNCLFSLNALMSLTNLRTLKLEGFKQVDGFSSSLSNLTKLVILSLHGSEFQESMEKLGDLQNLKVLDISQCKFLLGFPSNLIRRLFNLEELHLYDSTIKRLKFGASIISTAILPEVNFLRKLASLSLEVQSSHGLPEDFVFPRLQRYKIAINTSFQENHDHNKYYSNSSRFLRISKGLHLNVVSELLWNVEFLGVSNIMEKDIKCLTDTTSSGNLLIAVILRNLKGLRIGDCRNLEVIFVINRVENRGLGLLKKLQELWLCHLPNLEYIWKMPCTQCLNLGSLEAVKICGCGKLKSVFSFSLARSLVRLQKLEIDGCGELKQIVEELLEGDEQEILNPEMCFPKLRSVKIRNCDSLEYIFPNFMVTIQAELPQLKKLLMTRLSKLKQICRSSPPANGTVQLPQLQLLPSLMELTLCDCPELADATVHSKPLRAYLRGIRLSKLNMIINAKSLFLHSIKDHNLIPEVDGEAGLNELTSLELLSCHSLKYMVDTTKEHVPNRVILSNLMELFIREMDGLKMLCNGQFPKGFLQNLKKLIVEQCGQLQELFQMDDDPSYNRRPQRILSLLEHLGLHNLRELRWIMNARSAHYFSLQSLKVVNVFSCEKLKHLFSPHLVQSLVLLEELQIEDCNELETIFAELENDGGDHSHEALCLPRLSTLRISNCPRLEYVLPIALAQGLPHLKSVWVSTSRRLKKVFGETKDQVRGGHGAVVEHSIKLSRLKVLALRDLTNLSSFGPENCFVKTSSMESLYASSCPQLLKLTIQQAVINRVHLEGVQLFAFKEVLRNIKDLSLVRIIMDQKNLIPYVDLEGLTTLNLKGCKDLECLADTTEKHVATTTTTPSTSSGMFTNLVELVMENMIGLKMLCNGEPPKANFLSNLETLKVGNCSEIISLYPVARNLKTLFVKDCGKLQ